MRGRVDRSKWQVSFIAVNERVERHIKTRWLGLTADDGAAAGTDEDDATRRERAEDVRPATNVEMDSSADSDRRRPRAPSRPANFRAGIGRLLMGQSADFLLQTGVVAVTQIAGDVDATFDQLDADQSGELDLDELDTLLGLLGDGEVVNPQRVDALRAEIDGDGTGTVRRDAFRVWYLASEQRLRAEARRLFDEFDTDRSGDVDLAECEAVLAALEARWGVHARCGSAAELLAQIAGPGAERATFDAFHTWYQTSIFYERAQAEAELQAEATKSMWQTTAENVRGIGDLSVRERVVVLVCLPLNAVLGATVPDCTVPGSEKWCYATFLVSIAWIGAFAWLMVEGIEIIGRQIGVPVFIMALTFLAAGTRAPAPRTPPRVLGNRCRRSVRAQVRARFIVVGGRRQAGQGRHGRLVVHRLEHIRRRRRPAAALALLHHILPRARKGGAGQRRFHFHRHPAVHGARGHHLDHGVGLEDVPRARLWHVRALCRIRRPGDPPRGARR